MKGKGIRIPKNNAQNIINEIKRKNYYNNDLKIIDDGDFIIIPVKDYFSLTDYKISEYEFNEMVRKRNYRDFLNLDEEIKKMLPKSYDRIGNIVIIKLEKNLTEYEKEISEAILKMHKNVRTVAVDSGVKGEFRIRNLKIIHGNVEDTIYVENGIRMFANPFKVYFSPRLSNERKYISDIIEDNEVVFDLFCGSGPFSMNIARKRKAIIYSIDKNPYGIFLLRKSMKINNIENIIPIAGDIRIVLNNLPIADRIIMDLPFNSKDFLKYVRNNVRSGTKIHMYTMSERQNLMKMDEEWVSLKNITEVHQYSPRISMFRIDMEVK
ncbi:MAG: class I SAM-dependent methyltransferase [Thermoplasmata archaeon]